MQNKANRYFNPEIRILFINSARLMGMWNLDNLSAPYWRFYWNNKAGASVCLSGRKYPLIPSNFMLIPPDTPFSSACMKNEVSQFYVHFTAGAPFINMEPHIFSFPADSHSLELAQEGLKLVEGKKHDVVRLSMASLSLIAETIMKIPVKKFKKQISDIRILGAMKALEDNPSNYVSNPELARKANMSINAFLRLFRQHTGTSPQLYSRNKRIDKACILLHCSEMDIKHIADQTGFCDRYHFTKVFCRVRGETPCEFRRHQMI